MLTYTATPQPMRTPNIARHGEVQAAPDQAPILRQAEAAQERREPLA
jgi:hypothetical protein